MDTTTELRFVQISCVPVPNLQETQTVALLYGLTADGVVWSKRLQDLEWVREPMTAAGKTTVGEGPVA